MSIRSILPLTNEPVAELEAALQLRRRAVGAEARPRTGAAGSVERRPRLARGRTARGRAGAPRAARPRRPRRARAGRRRAAPRRGTRSRKRAPAVERLGPDALGAELLRQAACRTRRAPGGRPCRAASRRPRRRSSSGRPPARTARPTSSRRTARARSRRTSCDRRGSRARPGCGARVGRSNAQPRPPQAPRPAVRVGERDAPGRIDPASAREPGERAQPLALGRRRRRSAR